MARRRSGKKIDFTHWTYGSFAQAAQAAGTVAATMFTAQHEPETNLRFRGSMSCFIDGIPTPGDWASIGIGMILVPEGTGTTVLWSPITDGDAPWCWVSYFEVAYEERVTDVIADQNMDSYREVIDSKAMRIVRNQELQVVVENATLGTALEVNIALSGRSLSGT